ncbi:uncharacterized protein LOC135652512 [Musa acuminata AAA Group]|uniref:uncharacterized protein LOC135652512 n=1 Tax=Musa acuminata AAA Group TaxID=214697 RepID=UPI0031DC4EE8
MASFSFSWADEVEREEQEELEKAKGKDAGEEDEKQQPERKADPFGSARPREVVLEEKGVDWRKLDQELDAHSNLRNDKKLTGNVSLASSSISKKEHPLVGLGNHTDQMKPGHDPRSIRSQKHQNAVLVPPLRLLPKNIAPSLGHTHRGQSYPQNAALDSGLLSRHPCNSNTNTVHHFAVDPALGLLRVPQYSLSMVGRSQLRMQPNTGTLKHSQQMGSNCKMGVTRNKEMNLRNNHEDDGIRRCDHGKETHFLVAGEELQGDGRRILTDLNMGRTNMKKTHRVGESQAAKRKSCIQELTDKAMEPRMWIMKTNQNNDCLRSDSPGTENKVDDEGVELVGPSTSKNASSGKNNHNRKRGLHSAPQSGRHRRKQRNQAGLCK